MMTHTEKFDALLLEGDDDSMRQAAEHAAECEECAASLASWNEISSTARTMHETWQSDMLWPRIERKIRAERDRSRVNFWQIAAAFFLTALLGGGMYFFFNQRADQKSFDAVIMKDSALNQVEKAEREHMAAIDQLEKVAEAKLDQAGTPLMVSYREKLMLLDDAIRECQTNIEQNRQNAHLRKQLLSMYSEKQKTLTEVLREETTNVQNQ